ncbi:hypothetical protein FRC05_004908 [Tulasnella sp. 425]|nr:hypothetical protein FRC05_004908 [Tulasnella sp. 425]
MLQHGRMITQPTTVAGGQLRTSRATIKDLPLEIFCKITLLATLDDWDHDRYYDRLRFLRLVATSWSALIDNHPKFWTTISFRDDEPVWRMALKKSKAAEIDVVTGSSFRPEDLQPRLVEAIVGHMPRVRSLQILDRDFEDLIANAPAAPRLQSLSLNGDSDNEYSIALPCHPAKWAPNLRNVDLWFSCLIWKEPLWNNLERLRINTNAGLPLQEMFTILKASPGLRSLDILGVFPPGQRPLPVVELEALKYLSFCSRGGSPAEALNSIIARGTARFTVHCQFDASDETQVQSTLQSTSRFASNIVDGNAGTWLELALGSQPDRITMREFEVRLKKQVHFNLHYQTTLTQLFEGLPSSRREAVTIVKMGGTASNFVPAVFPIIHSFFPNVSHLDISGITEALEAILGRPNEGWLFPHLETLSLSHHDNGRRLMGVVEPRFKAAEAGEHVAQIKTLSLRFRRGKHIDKAETAELDALVPNIVVEHRNEEEKV